MDAQGSPVIGQGGAWRVDDAERPGWRTPSTGPSIRGILPGAAERTTVADPSRDPWRGIGLLNLFSGGNLVRIGTGFLSEPDVLVTARHNLLPATYDSAGVWLGYDRRLNSDVQPVRILAWATHTSLDLAVLVLSGRSAGSFQLGGPMPQAGAEVRLAGYAMPYPDNGARCSAAAGAVAGDTTARLSYVISTREGDSGAPVFVDGQSGVRAVCVHTTSAAAGDLGNSGQPLTPQVVADIQTMTAWARAQIGGQP